MLHVTIPFEEKSTSNLPGDNLRYYRQRKSLTTRQLAEQMFHEYYDEVEICTEAAEHHFKSAHQIRSRFMVNCSDLDNM